MALLELLKQQQAPRPMMGRANFSIQRPSPRARLDKFQRFKSPLDAQDNPAPFKGEGFERLTGNPENADVNIDVNAEIPMGDTEQQSGGNDQISNILAEISGIQGKDYVPRKKGGWKDILLGLGLGALQGAANSDPRGGIGAVLGGAIGGGAAGGIGGAVDGSTDNRMRDRLALDRLYGEYGKASKVADIETDRKYKQIQIQNAQDKPVIDRLKLDQKQRELEAKANLGQLNYERLVKAEEGRDRRAGNQTQVKEVDGYLFRVYPNDPKKEMEAIIDPRTGKQAFNPSNIAQEITFEDGTKAWAKGGQIVAGKFAAERQASGQQFQAGENEKTRAHQLLMASHTAKLRDLSSQREALLRDTNNAASQKRAADIQKEMIQLRQEMKDSESSLPSGLPVVGGPIQQ